jgi:hypothetical protein
MFDSLIPVITAVLGFLAKSLWDRYWTHRATSESRQIALRTDQLSRQLSEFYWPIYLRIERDNAVWPQMGKRLSKDPIEAKFGRMIESEVLLPNHAAIVDIIERNMHHSAGDEVLKGLLIRYIRHVAVYRVMRQAGILDRDPIAINEPWPKDLFEALKARTNKLQTEYDEIIRDTRPPPAGSHKPGAQVER